MAEGKKRAKYSQLANSSLHSFVPIAIETLGAWGPAAQEICPEIGGRIGRSTGDVRSSSFLRQRMDIAIQRGNAAAVLGTHFSTNSLYSDSQYYSNSTVYHYLINHLLLLDFNF